MAQTAYLLLMLVLLVAASKTHFEEQALIADTKQAGRLTKLADQ
jgi:hypothetical protein